MHLFVRNFRSWWQKPRSAQELLQHRQVSFLELFYDLVYVAIIAQISHAFSHDITPTGLGHFIFLFIIVWWAWFNGTMYHDIHGNDDVRSRTFMFLQMSFVVLMAIFAHNAIGDGAQGFALSYGGFQLVMTLMWWRVGAYDKKHRPFSTPYSLFFLLNTSLFIVSAFIDGDFRYWLWGIATLISLLLPLNVHFIVKNQEIDDNQMESMVNITPSLVERFGLLTIIVVGEVVVGVVNGAIHLRVCQSLVITAVLGTAVAISIWRIYFDFISHRLPKKGLKWVSSWYYLHLPITMGITASGAALVHIITHVNEPVQQHVQWLLLLSLILILLCSVVLIFFIRKDPLNHMSQKSAAVSMVIAIFLLILLGCLQVSSIALLFWICVIFSIPKFISFLVWLRGIDGSTSDIN